MKKTLSSFFLLALLPGLAFAQADQKLINKAQQGDSKAMVLLGECYEHGAGVDLDSTLALKWYQRAADLGDGEGWLHLSRYDLIGTLRPKDTAHFYSVRKEWADRGLPNALAALGRCYEYGYGVAVDSAKAIDLYQQAAKAGSTWGHCCMAKIYARGLYGLALDEKAAVSHWKKAWESGYHYAAGELAEYHFNRGNYKEAWKWVDEGAKWGDAGATTVGAVMLMNGYGKDTDEVAAQQTLSGLIARHHNLGYTQFVAGASYMFPNDITLRDSAKAMRIWEEGAHFGPENNSLCLIAIGRTYFSGGQYGKAIDYFSSVTENTFDRECAGEACQYLGEMYYGGIGCEADHPTAMAWFQRGAEVMHSAQCAMSLGEIYEAGPHEDLPKAVKYYRLADLYGEHTVLSRIGRLYASSGNYEMAMECYDKMIANGLADGYFYKAMIYEGRGDGKAYTSALSTGYKKGSALCAYGIGCLHEAGEYGYKVNYKKAAEFYTKADIAPAQYRLFSLYTNGLVGKGTEADIATGMDYLEQAAAAGYNNAIYALGCCHAYDVLVDTADQDKAVACFRALAEDGIPEGIYMMGLYYEGIDLSAPSVPTDSMQALLCFQKSADLGYAEAKCHLGDYYRAGQSVPKSCDIALSYYSQAYESGSAEGAYCIGRSYLEGCGVEVDTAQAIPYLKEAAAEGIGDAAYCVAELYNYGRGGLANDIDSTLAYYLTAYQNGNGPACFTLGKLYLLAGSEAEAFEIFLTGAKRGDVNSSLVLAACLQEGIGVEEADPKAAYELYQNIANVHKNPRAYGALGLACLQGNGCPEDDNLGKAYLDTAVSLGDQPSTFYLGVCYLSGLGCHADTAAAISWLEKAADDENIRAINTLGDVYLEQGEFKNAVLYYEKAVTLGDLDGYCNLGYCYQEGLGVVLNSKKAYDLYKYAADHAHNRACRLLADCYIKGIYVEPNVAQALAWLTQAADNDDVIAMYYCGAILEKGADGVPADTKKARQWYKKAATAGYEPAQAALSRMK